MKITLKQFEIFKKEALKWLEYFGMKEWRVRFEQREFEENGAQCTFDCVARIATLSLGTSWNGINKAFVTDGNIKRAAFHEVCELFLAPLGCMVFQINLSKIDVEEEVHRIIRTLENSLWKETTS